MVEQYLEHYAPIRNKDNLSSDRLQKTYEDRVDKYFHDNDFSEHEYLKHSADKLRGAMNKVYTRNNVLFSIDAVCSRRKVAQLGISIYDPRGQTLSCSPSIETFHIGILGYIGFSTIGVPNHERNFSGAIVYMLFKETVQEFVQALVDYYFKPPNVGCCLVGHDVEGNILKFARVGIKFPKDILTVDTRDVYSYSQGYHGCSLPNLLHLTGSPFAFLRNAGNKSYYTLMVAMKLCDPEVRENLRLDGGPKSCNPKNQILRENFNAKMRRERIRSNEGYTVFYIEADGVLNDLYLLDSESE